jgi:predicted nuclease of predicted toxin-antitoxin system
MCSFIHHGVSFPPPEDRQGDQIGRIFSRRVIVYFGQFLNNYRNSPEFRAADFQSKDYVLILTKKTDLGDILCDFFSPTHLVTLKTVEVIAESASSHTFQKNMRNRPCGEILTMYKKGI